MVKFNNFNSIVILFSILSYIFVYSCLITSWFPLLNTDTICFLPASVNFKFFDLFYNPLYHPDYELDAFFSYYPPLYPFITSLFLFENSLNSVFLAVNVFNLISGFLTIYISIVHITRNKHFNLIFSNVKLKFLFLYFFALLISFTLFPLSYSRPESLIRLLIVLVFFLNYTVEFRPFFLHIHSLVGFVGLFASPVGGIYLNFIIVFLYLQKGFSLKKVLLFLSLEFLWVIAFFLFYPVDPYIFFETIYYHSKVVFSNKSNSDFIRDLKLYHVFNYDYFLPVLAFISFFVVILRRFWNSGLKSYIFLFLFIVIYFGAKSLMLQYNVYVLMPLFIFYLSVEALNTNSLKNKFLFLSMLLLLSFSSLRNLSLFVLNYKINDSDRTRIVELISSMDDGESVLFTSSLWPFFRNFKNAKCLDLSTGINNQLIEQKPEFIFVQKTFSPSLSGGVLKGYELILDMETSETKLGMLKISNTYGGYQCRIYKKSKSHEKIYQKFICLP